jgi:hypothetical protein
MAACSQCGRPAIWEIGGHPICLEHWALFQSVNQRSIENLQLQMNDAEIEMAQSVGMPEMLAVAFAKREALIRRPVAQQTTNVAISHSVVGAVNTGTVKTLSVKMESLSKTPGSEEVAKALRAIAEGVLKTEALSAETKNEAVEQITYLVEQATAPPAERKTALVRAVMVALMKTLSVTADLVAVWNQWGPAVFAFFGAR